MPEGDLFQFEPDSTYVRLPPYFAALRKEPEPVAPITGARVLALLGDSITTDHISPAGSIKPDGPAGRYLIEHGVEPRDFNSYGSRRGNHEVMVRGTFANVRLRNRLAPGTEGGVTRHLPSGDVMSIFDASLRYARDGVPLIVIAGQEYGSRFVARLGGQGTAAARRAGGARRELRAHPPLEPGRHGHPAAGVPARRDRRDAGPDRRRGLRDRRGRRRARARSGGRTRRDRQGRGRSRSQ